MTPEKRERQPAGDPFLTMKGVDLKLGKQTVLDHVNLEVRRGELLALVGANGAGKSSILRCMAGVWEATEGEIQVDGLDRLRDDLAIRRFTAYLLRPTRNWRICPCARTSASLPRPTAWMRATTASARTACCVCST